VPGSANPEEILILATNPAGIAVVADSIDRASASSCRCANYATREPGKWRLLATGMREHHRPERSGQPERVLRRPFVAGKWALTDADHLGAAFYGRGGMNTKWVAARRPMTDVRPGTPTTFPHYGGGTGGRRPDAGLPEPELRARVGDRVSAGGVCHHGHPALRGTRRQHVCALHQDVRREPQPADRRRGDAEAPLRQRHDMSYGYGGTVGLYWRPPRRAQLRGRVHDEDDHVELRRVLRHVSRRAAASTCRPRGRSAWRSCRAMR